MVKNYESRVVLGVNCWKNVRLFCYPCSEAHFQSADSLIFAGFKSAKLFGHGLLSFVLNIFEA